MTTVLFCWILPLILVIGFTGFYASGQLSKQIVDNIEDSVSVSADICAAQISNAVNASYAATYSSDIQTNYKDYLNGGIDTKGNETLLFAKIHTFLTQQYRYDSQFEMTELYFTDVPEQRYYVYDDSKGYSFLTYQKFLKNVHSKIVDYAKTLDTRVGFCCYDGNYYMVRNLVDSFTFKPYATLVMQLRREMFFDNLTNVIYGTDTTVWFGNSALPLKGKQISREETQEKLDDEKKDPYLIVATRKLDAFTMQYAIRIDNSQMLSSMAGFQWMMVLMCLFAIPLLGWALLFFNRKVTDPIENFLDAYKKVGRGQIGIHVEKDFHNMEFDYFTQAFNRMSDQLKSQFEQIYSDELALRDAKIMALQAQINPHFLNNTLEFINWEARMIGNERISGMIEALSTMLDAAMDRKAMPKVTLEQEMDYVNAYLYIISKRLGGRLTVRKEIDESLYSCEVPRLVMQPILENAVEHGVEDQMSGMIVIRAYQQDHSLILEVENTGEMSVKDKEKIEELLSDGNSIVGEQTGSLGIHNVYQRLRILYDSEGDLSISSSAGGNTVARIKIPFKLQ